MLAGCGRGGAPAASGTAIGCALDGATEFQTVCAAERVGNAIVVRRPDGGFRRIVRTADGAATDGTDATTTAQDGTLTIGTDRYRLPR